ncbi:MAG: carbohydrate ABC transporter permease [Oscillospiraceae bacterium]|nr:carbohydrate ABC transporter permease [Oscillospiraceae bacterium]
MDNGVRTDFSTDIKSSVSSFRRIQQSPLEKTFNVFNYVLFALLSLMMLYPFWHQLMMSLSNVHTAAAGGVFLWPKQFTLSTYQTVLRSRGIMNGFRVSLIVTITGTAAGTLITAMLAYPLSKLHLRGNAIFMFFIVFTMLFNGGMIPNYMLIRDLKMLDTLFALILPGLAGAFNIIIMRSFFASLPSSLEESAKIDGANDVFIFFRIIIPLSMATVATIALFTAVMYWNDYFSTVLYITSKSKWSMQAELRNLLMNTSQALRDSGVQLAQDLTVSENTIKAASIIVTTTPILIVYPFLQRYFVKGVMIGSIKG